MFQPVIRRHLNGVAEPEQIATGQVTDRYTGIVQFGDDLARPAHAAHKELGRGLSERQTGDLGG